MLRGRGRLRAGGSSGFNPSSLFAAGEQGGFYNIANLATLFSDTAGTTPASVDGQVARINDLSGRGNNLTQSTSSSQAILRNSGGLYWLEFDGLDDGYGTSSFNAGATTAHMASLRSAHAAASVGSVFDGNSTLVANRQLIGTMSSTNWRMSAGASVSSAASTRDASDHILFGNFAAASSTLELDAVQIATGNPSTGALSAGIRLGSDAGVAQPFNGRFYGGLIIGRSLTASEKSALYTHLGRLAGLTL